MTDWTKMTWYELQHALYAAHDERDREDTRKQGIEKVLAIYKEYARRGVTKVVAPEL
jgi:hypothetical protein